MVLTLGKATTYGFSHLHQRVYKKESVSQHSFHFTTAHLPTYKK